MFVLTAGRMKKPWWNENLTVLWNDVCKADGEWRKCKNPMQKEFTTRICGETEELR